MFSFNTRDGLYHLEEVNDNIQHAEIRAVRAEGRNMLLQQLGVLSLLAVAAITRHAFIRSFEAEIHEKASIAHEKKLDKTEGAHEIDFSSINLPETFRPE